MNFGDSICNGVSLAQKIARAAVVLALAIPGAVSAEENSADQALLLFTRLSGIRPLLTDTRLAQMASLIDEKKFLDAADIATKDDNFYNLTVYQFFAPKSVRTASNLVPLNDFIAMGIANTMLQDTNGNDFPYTNMVDGDFTVQITTAGLAAPSLADNNHFQQAYDKRVTLTKDNLQIVTPQRPGFPDAAGSLTSRQFMSEHANAGTNRRLLQFAFRNYLCTDIKQWRDGDPALADDMVTRDVSRAPGGDAARYQSECRTCHQLQDPMRKALAFHDFDPAKNTPVYTPGVVAPKINKNILFPGGFIVADDSWENRATRNHNVQFGWRGVLNGNGAKSLGAMIGRASRFSTCAVEQVWALVCREAPGEGHRGSVELLGQQFENDGYSLRQLFKRVAVTPGCMKIGE